MDWFLYDRDFLIKVLTLDFNKEETLLRTKLLKYFTLDNFQIIKLYFKRYMVDWFLL